MENIKVLMETILHLLREERDKATQFSSMSYIYRLDFTKLKLEEALEEWNN